MNRVLTCVKQLTVARRTGDTEVRSTMFTRILLAIDDSSSSEAAVSFAMAMALQSHGSVRVVHVNEYLVGGRGFTVETQTQAIDHLESAVAALRQAGIPTGGSLYLTTCFGVEDRIATAAHDWSADVIVLGSRRRHRFSRFGGKGMRERVTNLTALPVLTAPAPLEVTGRRLPDMNELPVKPLADFPSISI
jgi:nucleotide-binding universal stress UspA family protein